MPDAMRRAVRPWHPGHRRPGIARGHLYPRRCPHISTRPPHHIHTRGAGLLAARPRRVLAVALALAPIRLDCALRLSVASSV